MNPFKRYIFFCLRVTSHIPGYKSYSRWLTKKYEKNFWRTFIIVQLSNVAFVVALRELSKWLVRREEAQRDLESLQEIADEFHALARL